MRRARRRPRRPQRGGRTAHGPTRVSLCVTRPTRGRRAVTGVDLLCARVCMCFFFCALVIPGVSRRPTDASTTPPRMSTFLACRRLARGSFRTCCLESARGPPVAAEPASNCSEHAHRCASVPARYTRSLRQTVWRGRAKLGDSLSALAQVRRATLAMPGLTPVGSCCLIRVYKETTVSRSGIVDGLPPEVP